MGVLPDPSLFSCERSLVTKWPCLEGVPHHQIKICAGRWTYSLISYRCDTFLQPDFNCTVRIEKNRAKARCGQKKSNNSTLRNVVIYKCHFCSHWNLKRGTQKGHMKEISPSKSKTSSKSEAAKVRLQQCGKRNQSISKKPAETNSTPTRVEKAVTSSNKRRRKSWTSLKEIAESTEHASNGKITNSAIPFCM